MLPTGMFVKDGKVVFKAVADTCEAGNHVFSRGPSVPCDCAAWPNFNVAETSGVAQEEPMSQEPVLVKKHLALILGGKK